MDRESYATFWLDVMENKGMFYFVLMGILAGLCVMGIVTFFRTLLCGGFVALGGGGFVLGGVLLKRK